MNRPTHRMARVFLAGLLIGMAALASSAPTDAITITPADFRVAQSEIMEQVARLELTSSATVSTADYALSFQQLQKDIARADPPLSQWSDEDQQRIKALPEPTEAAWQALSAQQERTQARLREQAVDAEQAHAQLLQQRTENARRQAAAETAQRDAALKEAQIRESMARPEYYEDAGRYYPIYGNNWWWNRPGKPIPVPPGENRYYGTKPVILDFKGRSKR